MGGEEGGGLGEAREGLEDVSAGEEAEEESGLGFLACEAVLEGSSRLSDTGSVLGGGGGNASRTTCGNMFLRR